MDTIKVRGLIVKENYVGDEQKVIVILTKERGKLSVWIKDARKAKTKFITATVFSYADFVLYCGKSSYSLCEISLIENFYELTTELDKLAYASYIAEMAEKTTLEGDSCTNTLYLVLKTMQAISSGVIDPKLAAVVFDIKYIQLQGYMPMVKNCAYCEKEINENKKIYFGGSGVVCEKCLSKEAELVRINPAAVYTMRYILSAEIKKLFSFNVSDELFEMMRKISRRLVNEHIPVKIKSYDFIEETEKMAKILKYSKS